MLLKKFQIGASPMLPMAGPAPLLLVLGEESFCLLRLYCSLRSVLLGSSISMLLGKAASDPIKTGQGSLKTSESKEHPSLELKRRSIIVAVLALAMGTLLLLL